MAETGGDGMGVPPTPPPSADPRPASNGAAAGASVPKPSRPPKPPKVKPPRPDHFLSLRLSHAPCVTEAFQGIHSHLLAHSPHLQPALVDPHTAHMTLGVLHLADSGAKDAAANALQEAIGAIASAGLEGGLKLNIGGLGHFRNSVLFLECEANDSLARLHDLVGALRSHFNAVAPGLLVQHDRAFEPHITVAKLSKAQPWKHRNKGNNRGRQRGGRALARSNEASSEPFAMVPPIPAPKATTAANDPEVVHGIDVSTTGMNERTEDIDAATVDESLGPHGREVHDEQAERQQRRGTDAAAAAAAEQSPSRQRVKPIISPEAYAEVASLRVGEVEVTSIELCEMAGRKPGEYYKVVSSISLQTESMTVDDAMIALQ